MKKQLPGLLFLIAVVSSPHLANAKDDVYIAPPGTAELDAKTFKKIWKLEEIHKAFKQHNRLLIGNYRVAYSVAKSSYAKEMGGSSTTSLGNGWESVTHYKDQELRATAELVGVDSADLNAITEAGYQDLIARLEAVGREVIRMDQISDSAVIAKELELNPVDKAGEYWTNFGIGEARELVTVTWPDNTPLWFMFGDTLDAGGSYKAAFNALSMKNFGFIKSISGEQDAGMLDVSVIIRFANTWSLRGKTLRSAQVGVVPGMKMQLAKVSLSTAKVTQVGIYPGPSGNLKFGKSIAGFDLGDSWATYNQDIHNKNSLSATGQTIELIVTTTPESMHEGVLAGLHSLNAAIAQVASENPAKSK